MSDLSKYPAWRMWLGRAAFFLPRLPERGGGQHFVRDYSRLVRRLKADYRPDEAMNLPVGGGAYHQMGARLADVVQSAIELRPGMRLLDLGCGAGRLAAALQHRAAIGYLGLDIIPALLAYARQKCPRHYRFALARGFTVPSDDAAFDVVCAFSLFTHLKHEESFAYLREARRVLRPGGVLILSFLEFAEPHHWSIFDATLDGLLRRKRSIANVFVERPSLALWADKLGFEPPRFISPGADEPAGRIGQSVAILRVPA